LNSGHFIQEYRWSKQTGSRVIVLGEGRLINLAAAEGQPCKRNGYEFCEIRPVSGIPAKEPGKTGALEFHTLPAEVDTEIASLKLKALGISIDTLTSEQIEYIKQLGNRNLKVFT